jgi:uncharacterized protein
VTLEPPLSEAEIDELDAFLTSEATSDECMDIFTLDGFLTALVIAALKQSRRAFGCRWCGAVQASRCLSRSSRRSESLVLYCGE